MALPSFDASNTAASVPYTSLALKASLEAEQQRLRQTIDDHIDRHPPLKQDRQHLLSIPGIGPVLAGLMVALLQSGHRFASAAPFASYLGVIPTEHESGSSVRHRPHLSKLGPARVRAKLYMVALGAAMRKLAHICFGVIKNQTDFQPQTTQKA